MAQHWAQIVRRLAAANVTTLSQRHQRDRAFDDWYTNDGTESAPIIGPM